MAKLVFADIEADGLKPTKIHCISIKVPSLCFKYTFTDMEQFTKWVDLNGPFIWVFHNGLGYDVKNINRLVRKDLIDPSKVIDTFVVSRLINYTKFMSHSLDELGKHLGVYKGSFSGPWDVCTEDMITYCEQDVEVLEAIYNYYSKYIKDPEWKKALRVEHDMAAICSAMSDTGFYFNKPAAEEMLKELTAESENLRTSFAEAFPPTLQEVNRIKYRTKANGELYKNVEDAYSKYPMCEVQGDELVCFDYVAFNPNSKEDRIDVLWDSGWKPTDKTDGYKKFLKEQRR